MGVILLRKMSNLPVHIWIRSQEYGRQTNIKRLTNLANSIIFQHTRELLSTQNTWYKYNNKDLSYYGNSHLACTRYINSTKDTSSNLFSIIFQKTKNESGQNKCIYICLSQHFMLISTFCFTTSSTVVFLLVMMMSWCLVSSDVSWHIRDKLWPMPKHGSIILYVHGNQKAR